MKLHVISSSSEGNAYAIEGNGETLLLEAGAPFEGTLKAIGYQVKNIVGCLVTHEHGDHAGRVKELADYCVDVWTSPGTAEKIAGKLKPGAARCLRTFRREAGAEVYETFSLGRFEVTPFATQHDSAEPVGYYITHPETGGILFATDTYYLRPTFAGLRHVLIECNHDSEKLQANAYDRIHGMTPELAQRIRESHLSLQTCISTLKANDLSQVNEIVLIHLSKNNGDPAVFKKAVATATGLPTYIGRPGLTLDFNINPF